MNHKTFCHWRHSMCADIYMLQPLTSICCVFSGGLVDSLGSNGELGFVSLCRISSLHDSVVLPQEVGSFNMVSDSRRTYKEI